MWSFECLLALLLTFKLQLDVIRVSLNPMLHGLVSRVKPSSPPAFSLLHNRDVIQTSLCYCGGMITDGRFCCVLNTVLFVLSMYTPRWQMLFFPELSAMGY